MRSCCWSAARSARGCARFPRSSGSFDRERKRHADRLPILLVEVVLFRKWCRKLCPLGALMSLLSCKAPLVKPHVDAGACLRSKGVDCRVCVDACPELLDPHSPCIPECTKCGLCAERCPHQAIDLRLGFTSTKRLR